MFQSNIIKDCLVKKKYFICAKDEHIAKFYICGMKYLFESDLVWLGNLLHIKEHEQIWVIFSLSKSRATFHIKI